MCVYRSGLSPGDSKGLPCVAVGCSAEPPITLKVRRGGPEPWTLERDGSGLSVEEMVRAAGVSYGIRPGIGVTGT